MFHFGDMGLFVNGVRIGFLNYVETRNERMVLSFHDVSYDLKFKGSHPEVLATFLEPGSVITVEVRPVANKENYPIDYTFIAKDRFHVATMRESVRPLAGQGDIQIELTRYVPDGDDEA